MLRPFHHMSVVELVESYLRRLQCGDTAQKEHELPSRLKRLCGILSDVRDDEDDRLNYLLNK